MSSHIISNHSAPATGYTRTCFFFACERGSLEEIQIGLDTILSANCRNCKGEIPLEVVAMNGHVEAARLLLKQGKADVFALTSKKETLFYLAVSLGDIGLLKLFVKHAPSNEWREWIDRDGLTLLHRALFLTPLPEIVRFLLASELPPNRQNRLGDTPLHWAAKHGHFKSALSLLRAKAKTEVRNKRGKRAIELAIEYRQEEVVHLLLAYSQEKGEKTLARVEKRVDSFRSLKKSSDPKGEAYLRFEQSYREQDHAAQLFWLESLSQLYLRDGEFLHAAHLLNGALALIKKESPFEVQFLSAKLDDLLALYLKKVCGKELPRGYRGAMLQHRAQLKKMRSQVACCLKRGVSADRIGEIVTNAYHRLLSSLVKESALLLGRGALQNFALLGLGSIARGECAPFSDVEFAFLIRKSQPEVKKKFESLSQILTLLILNVGETQFDLIRSQRGVMGECIAPKSVVASGFQMDHGGLSPSGCAGVYSLIGTPEELARFQNRDWASKHDSEEILINAMTAVRCLMGDASLVEKYRKLVVSELASGSLRQQRARRLMEGHLKEFAPQLNLSKIYGRDARAFDVKRELYRPIQSLISALALHFAVEPLSTKKRIQELLGRGFLSKEGAHRLGKAFSKVLWLRTRTHLFYQSSREILYFPRNRSISSESRWFIVNDSTKKEIREIYRVIVPFQRVVRKFVAGELSSLKWTTLYDGSIGSAQSHLLQKAALNPYSGRLIERVATFMEKKGRRQVANQLIEDAALLLEGQWGVRIEERVSGRGFRHKKILSQQTLALQFIKCGDLEKARHYQEESIRVISSVYPLFGSEHQPGAWHSVSYDEYMRILTRTVAIYRLVGEPYKAVKLSGVTKWKVKSGLREKGNGAALFLKEFALAYFDMGLLSKARATLDDAILNVQPDCDRDKGQFALHSICHSFGSLLVSCADYSSAIATLKRVAHYYLLSNLAESGVDCAMSLQKLGDAYFGQGEFEKALSLYDQALERMGLIYPKKKHIQIGVLLNQMGDALCSLGRYREAALNFKRSLEMVDSISRGSPHWVSSDALFGLSRIELALGRFSQAEQLLHQSDQRIIQIVRADHYGWGGVVLNTKSQNRLSCFWLQIGEYEKALEEAVQVRILRRHLSGKRVSSKISLSSSKESSSSSQSTKQPNPKWIESLKTLGHALSSFGLYSEAVNLLRESIEMGQIVYENRAHPLIAESEACLALVYRRLGDSNQAIQRYYKALDHLHSLHLHPAHPMIIDTLVGISDLLYAAGHFSDAASYCKCALLRNQESRGIDQTFLLKRMGAISHCKGDRAQASSYFKEAIGLLQKRGSVEVADCMHQLALVQRARGSEQEATRLNEVAKRMLKKLCRQPDMSVFYSLSQLGHFYRDLGEHAKSVKYHNLALSMEKRLGRKGVLITLSHLTNGWRALGQYQRALEYNQQSFKKIEKVYGKTGKDWGIRDRRVTFYAKKRAEEICEERAKVALHPPSRDEVLLESQPIHPLAGYSQEGQPSAEK